MPNTPMLSPAQWRKVQNDFVYGGMTINELAVKYAVSIGSVKARCYRGQWLQLRNRFENACRTPAITAPVDQNTPQPPASNKDALEFADIDTRHAQEDETELTVLLALKRDLFLRETIRTAEIMLAQIQKRAQAVDLENDSRLKGLVATLSDLISTIKGPLALEDDKPPPRQQMAVQVNILNSVMEQADKMSGKQGRSPTASKTIDL